MNGHYLQLAEEKAESLKGQLEYARQKLTDDGLEPWERKEWLQTADALQNDLTKAQEHSEHVLEMCEGREAAANA